MSEPRRRYDREGQDLECIPGRIRESGLCGDPPGELFLKIEVPGGRFTVAIERKSAIQLYKAIHLIAEKVPDFFQE